MKGDAGVFLKLFPQNHIPLILCSICDVGKTIRKKTENDREDWITTRICACLIRISVFRDGPLEVHLQQEIPTHDINADHVAGKIDIVISCGKGSHTYFAIEAKRLRFLTPKGIFKAGNSEYVNAGMMRFVRGQYAPFMETGAMLAYVFDGDITKAHSGVSGYIQKKKEDLRLIEPKRLVRSGILTDKKVDETKHDLNERSFTIYHIFLSI